ncbi:MAG: TadE/TadG family type IV pilus assembly protein [Huintestinicola sp.]|uniref:TadE/TadG family type IV pilus assembly protein n=1 Tax=Huintestinicola sp. TaxID=2981661 RepID=UPI003F05A4DC
MKKDERGAMFVEAALVLPIFMIAVLSFISLISLYTVHSKMQYAITQTSNEVATYSYFYSYLGLREVNGKVQQINNSNLKTTDNAIGNMIGIIDASSSVISSLSKDVSGIGSGEINVENFGDNIDFNSYKENFSSIENDAESLGQYIDALLNDPKLIIKWILGYCANSALENGKAALGSYLLYPALTYKYLGYNGGDKEAFLSRMGISNIDFSNSSLLPEISGDANKSINNRVVDVIVTYDYTLPFTILPKEASTFHIVQRAVSLSWGEGDDSYKYPN